MAYTIQLNKMESGYCDSTEPTLIEEFTFDDKKVAQKKIRSLKKEHSLESGHGMIFNLSKRLELYTNF